MTHQNPLSHFLAVCSKPGMFLSSQRYEAVCAYLIGYDSAAAGGVLRGFREYVLFRHFDAWKNLPWWLLIRCAAVPEADLAAPVEGRDDALLRARLAEELREFSSIVEAGGLEKIYWEYSHWLSARSDSEARRLFKSLTSE